MVSASTTLYVNGNSATTNTTTSAGNNTLHFAATPSWITAGVQIADATTPAAIPSGTTVLSVTGTTAVLSANVVGAGVGNGDVITASATCGTTGASTCGPGSDANDCLRPATACLTAQRALNLFLNHIHSAGFGNAINLAHAASPNYAMVCEGGPFLGTAVIAINGDVNAATAAAIEPPLNGNALAYKDGCTLGFNNVAFADNASSNGGNFIVGGVGNSAHVDLNNISFGALTSGIAINLTYGASVTFDGPCFVTGSMVAFFDLASGAVLDMAGACTGSAGLTFSIPAFAIVGTGAIINGAQALTAGSPSFPGFSGINGRRCNISGSFVLGGLQNPNSVFPGSSDCVPLSFAGAAGLPSGSGASSTYTYGNSGQAWCSGGSSSSNDLWCNPVPTAPTASTLGGIESIVATTHQWIDPISTSGVPHQSQPATSDLSDVTAPTSWTAADGSGVSISLTTSDTLYTKMGKVCTVSFAITYPSTSDTSTAQVSGIPSICAAKNGTLNYVAGGTGFGGSGSTGAVYVALQRNGQSLFFFTSGNPQTNANMSGSTVRGTITYITN